jgi:hypothetical protein
LINDDDDLEGHKCWNFVLRRTNIQLENNKNMAFRKCTFIPEGVSRYFQHSDKPVYEGTIRNVVYRKTFVSNHFVHV